MNAVTGVGAPSYTSGVHTWNGTAAALNPSPTIISATPARTRASSRWRVDRVLEVGDDLADVGGAGAAVEQRDPVEEERRREAAEHEVLHAALLAPAAAPIGGGEHVERERQRLEADEQHDQVVGRGHHDAADGGHQVQRVHLGAVDAGAPQLVAGHERHEDDRDADRDRQELGERVEGERPRHDRRCALVGDVVPLEHRQPAGGTGDERRERSRNRHAATSASARRRRAASTPRRAARAAASSANQSMLGLDEVLGEHQSEPSSSAGSPARPRVRARPASVAVPRSRCAPRRG